MHYITVDVLCKNHVLWTYYVRIMWSNVCMIGDAMCTSMFLTVVDLPRWTDWAQAPSASYTYKLSAYSSWYSKLPEDSVAWAAIGDGRWCHCWRFSSLVLCKPCKCMMCQAVIFLSSWWLHFSLFLRYFQHECTCKISSCKDNMDHTRHGGTYHKLPFLSQEWVTSSCR